MGVDRIALFLPSLRGGGAERVMLTLAGGIAMRGVPVDLVLAQAVGPYLDRVPNNVNIVDLSARSVLFSLPRLVAYLRRSKPKALLTAQGHANVIGIWASKLARVATNVVVTEHVALSESVGKSRNLYVRFIGLCMRLSYPAADRVVAVSDGVADNLAEYLGFERRKVYTIYNPVVTEELFKHASEPVVHPWFEAGEPPVLIAVGRLMPQKDFSTLIRAFAAVRKEVDARLIIFGEGSERAKLESLVQQLEMQDCIQLPGFVTNPYSFMKQAALFVLSSAWEGLPTVLIEAMACGTPVVATNCPSGPQEILGNGRWGALVPVGDCVALADAIVSQLESRARINVAVRAMDFSLEAAVDKYLELLRV